MNTELSGQLHPPRLPAELAAVQPGDLVAAFGAGLLLAVLIYLLLRLWFGRRPRRRERVADELRELANQASAQRLLGQARLRARLGAADDPAWRRRLYQPDQPIDHAALDAEILALAERREGN